MGPARPSGRREHACGPEATRGPTDAPSRGGRAPGTCRGPCAAEPPRIASAPEQAHRAAGLTRAAARRPPHPAHPPDPARRGAARPARRTPSCGVGAPCQRTPTDRSGRGGHRRAPARTGRTCRTWCPQLQAVGGGGQQQAQVDRQLLAQQVARPCQLLVRAEGHGHLDDARGAARIPFTGVVRRSVGPMRVERRVRTLGSAPRRTVPPCRVAHPSSRPTCPRRWSRRSQRWTTTSCARRLRNCSTSPVHERASASRPSRSVDGGVEPRSCSV